jgi:very-short-patch-repair endonuclease/endogenous inhibitor of DNA gyrase (YacG/DUF329 family)
MKTICATCGKEITIKPRDFRETGNYCSRDCHYKSGKPRPNRRNGTNKDCEVCGSTFYVSKTSLDQKYCSRACKGIASRKPTKVCPVCGKEWQPKPGGRPNPYCSRECFAIGRRTGTWLPCPICGKDFYKPKSSNRRFCSNECLHTWQRRTKVSYTCIICGKEFKWSPSREKQNNVKYCSITCRNADPKQREHLLRMNQLQQVLSPSSIERIGYGMLDSLGVDYLTQHMIGGKFCVDAFLPEHKLVIQFDGDYWHGNPTKFPTLDHRQTRRKKLDLSQDAYMNVCGYTVVRIWESELKKHPHTVIALLQRLVTERSPDTSPPA